MPWAVVMFKHYCQQLSSTDTLSFSKLCTWSNEDKSHEPGLSEVLLIDYKVIAHWDPDF